MYYARFVRNYKLDLAKSIGEEYGVLPEDLIAICIKEGFLVENRVAYGCRNEAIGDHGHAKGAFQILDYHGATAAQRRDFAFSARWTAERMVRKGYRADSEYWRKRAIKLHNGNSERAVRYARSVLIASPQIKKYLES